MKKALAITLTAAMAMSANGTILAEEITGGSQNGVEDNVEISVYGTYGGSTTAEEVISVDVQWDTMKFTYAAVQQGAWDAESHTYGEDRTGVWLNDTANITLKNHSNTAIEAALTFTNTAAGVSGTFSADSVSLENAATASYQDPDHAPEETVSFTIGGDMSSSDTTLGNILITLDSVEEAAVLDLSSVADDDIAAAVTAFLQETGETTLNVKMAEGSTLTKTQVTNINTGIMNADMTGISATISGATTIGEYAFAYGRGSRISSLTCTDATKIEDYGFQGATSMTTLNFPKVTYFQTSAFANCTNLTTLTFGSFVSSVGSSAFSGVTTGNITLTLNEAQDQSNWGVSYGCTWGENATWAGSTWKTILKYGK